ncbi:FAD-dependent oxidoreductase [Symbiobacterium terraclitae]|uniref:FAD-dependent oxidoreductase n=1 Tax=Symbiobacterium terraclitae TaxID=557451 RepID=UPI0035B55292
MSQRKIVIVGGVAGGATAAARARRTDEHAEIVLFEKGPYISFANCGLPYYVGGEIGDRSALLLQTPESFRARFGVDVRVNHEVLAIDRAAKAVAVRNLETGAVSTETYTALILAPGSIPIRPPLPGIDLPNVFMVRTVPDAVAIRAFVEERQASRAVVVGAGFIGLEMVENLVNLGLGVTLVEKADQVLPPLDPEIAAVVQSTLEQMGVEVITGDGIAAFEGAERATAVRLESGRTVEGDLFVLGLGVRPDTRLAREAGLAIGPTGGIKVNERMQTSDPAIYAAGDAVETVHLVTGRPALIPLAGPANKQGRVAGANAAGDSLTFPGAIGTAIVRVGNVVAATTGLSERAARREGLQVYTSYTLSGDHADYYPGVHELLTKLVVEEGTGRVLGAQVVGEAGVDKRTDVYATAILGGMTVEQLANLDLAYAPPFGSAKDPAVVAGMVAQNIRRGTLRTITPDRLLERLEAGEGLQVVDVRNPYEFDMGAVPGAVNIPVDELRSRIGELDPARETVVYDRTGATAYVAARMLMQRGFSVSSLTGGYALFPAAEAVRMQRLTQG